MVKEVELDDYGRVITETADPGGLALQTQSTYDINGNKLTATDANGNTTAFTYDARNRLKKVEYADHTTKLFDYDARGNKIRETDENGHVTELVYDEMNRVKEQRRLMAAGGPLVTTFTYNAVGARVTVTDANLNVTTTDTQHPAASEDDRCAG